MKQDKLKELLAALSEPDESDALVEIVRLQTAAMERQSATMAKMVTDFLSATDAATDKLVALLNPTARRIDAAARRDMKRAADGGDEQVATSVSPGAVRRPLDDEEAEPEETDVTDELLASGVAKIGELVFRGDRLGQSFGRRKV